MADLFNPQELICSRHSGAKQLIDIIKTIIVLIWKHNDVFPLKITPVVLREEDGEGQRHACGSSSHHYTRNGAVHHETTHSVHLPFFLLNKHWLKTSVHLHIVQLCRVSFCFYLTSSYKINYTSILPRDQGEKKLSAVLRYPYMLCINHVSRLQPVWSMQNKFGENTDSHFILRQWAPLFLSEKWNNIPWPSRFPVPPFPT